MPDIEIIAPSYKIIETATLQPGDDGKQAYALVDREEHVIWLYSGTPDHLRPGIISEALQTAAQEEVSRVRRYARPLD